MSAAGSEVFPWQRIMHMGLHVLRLPPTAFWAMTPKELAAACGPERAVAMERAVLAQLMEEFPDG